MSVDVIAVPSLIRHELGDGQFTVVTAGSPTCVRPGVRVRPSEDEDRVELI